MVRWTLVAVLVLSCSDAQRSGEPSPTSSGVPARERPSTSAVAQPSTSAAPQSSATAGASAAAAPPPELLTRLEAGLDCQWAENGLPQSCPGATALERYVDANKTEVVLSGCLAALADTRPAVRKMVGTCLYQYHFGNSDQAAKPYSARVFDAVLPAMLNETDEHGRAALANGVWQHSAASAERVDAVVATVRKLDRDRDGHAIGSLMDTLHEIPIASDAPELPKSVVDLALEVSQSPSAWARRSAYSLLSLAPTRASEVCPVLAKATESGSTWREAVYSLAQLDAACAAQHEAVTSAIVAHLERGAAPTHPPEDDVSSVSELLTYVHREAVPAEHKERIAKAADQLLKAPKLDAREKGYVQHLADAARGKEKK